MNQFEFRKPQTLTFSMLMLMSFTMFAPAHCDAAGLARATPKELRAAFTRLIGAIESGNSAAALACLKSGANPNGVTKQGLTPLIDELEQSPTKSRDAIVAALLLCGANPNAPAPDGTRPLRLAVNNDDIGAVSDLLNDGASMLLADSTPDGQTLLSVAVSSGDLPLTKLLVSKGEPVKSPAGSASADPVAIACGTGNIDLLKFLLESGADVHRTPGILGYAASAAAVQLLFDYGAIVYEPNALGQPPLLAVLLSQPGAKAAPVVQALLAHGANPNLKCSNSEPALTLAVDSSADGSVDTVALLLVAGANPNAADATGWTPLMEAAYFGEEKSVALLLKYGARTSIQDKYGRSALTNVAFAGGVQQAATPSMSLDSLTVRLSGMHDKSVLNGPTDAQITSLLLQHGASAVDQNGAAALELAVETGKASVVQTLLKSGANADQIVSPDIDRYQPLLKLGGLPSPYTYVPNDSAFPPKGMTVLMMAIFLGFADCAADLVAHSLRPNLADSTGATALNYAASAGDAVSVCNLLERGADPKHVDNNGDSPLINVTQNGRSMITDVQIAALKNQIALLSPSSAQARALGAKVVQIEAAGANGDRIAASVLIAHGADPSQKDKFGQSALSIATDLHRLDLIGLFDKSSKVPVPQPAPKH